MQPVAAISGKCISNASAAHRRAAATGERVLKVSSLEVQYQDAQVEDEKAVADCLGLKQCCL